MMLKDLAEIQQQQLLAAAEENMSNLTSASGDQASVSSHPAPPPAKKKRSLPGNPDPEAEVIALSPRTLMATNRYVCEICGKGFQRDQNLQLHRRGHNLPWKLKQRNPKEVVRKKVYVCPEAGCVHHDPARALGDLTGIKKHFSRKHGEKKWKCDKCSKRYAVHSDWKAHSKVCGTREYRCDCGTLFSRRLSWPPPPPPPWPSSEVLMIGLRCGCRRDSFITHRAFCDALAEESARAVTAAAAVAGQQQHGGGMLFSQVADVLDHQAAMAMGGHGLMQELCLKREQQQQQQQFAPSWLTAQQQQQQLEEEKRYGGGSGRGSRFRSGGDEFIGSSTPESGGAQQAGLSFGFSSTSSAPPHPAASSAHMSATALLQKAAQMGATLSRPSSHAHMAAAAAASTHNSSSSAATTNAPPPPPTSNVSSTCVGAGGYGLAFEASHFIAADESSRGARSDRDTGNGVAGAGNDGLTRDFLGLRAFSHGNIMSMAGFDPCMSTTSASSAAPYDHHHHSNKPWHS
uniref:C2H2-type domain-containing protein n=1 Tax=Oryza rufipogon TaxID=4529 RepID=A0A0E0MSL4_ORYRU